MIKPPNTKLDLPGLASSTMQDNSIMNAIKMNICAAVTDKVKPVNSLPSDKDFQQRKS